MTASLILTLSACGGGSEGSGENSAPSGGQETAAAADYVYSAEQVIIEDEAGELGDLSIDNLFFKDGKLYATGFYFGDSFTGSHVIMTFNPDGTDLQYTTLMGGMEDIITTTVGTDGNFYIAGLSYDADSIGAAQTGSTQDQEHAAETVPDDVEISGSDDMDSFTAEEVPGGPGSAVEEEDMTAPGEGPTADTEDASYGPTDVAAEEEAEYGPGEDVEEFISEGEESPADEAGEEASDGITSPQDEFGDDPSEYDGEEELTVGDVEEVEGGYTESGEAIYVLSCMSADGQQIWSAAANAGNEADADYYINSIAYSDKGILVGSSKGLELYSKDDGSFIKMLSSGEETIGCTPYVMNDGTAVIMTAGSKGEELTAVDMESGALGTHYPIPGEAGMVSIFPGKTYDFYLTGTGAVFGMNLDDSGAVKVIDYVDSDMDITAMPCLTEMDDGTFAAVVNDAAGTNAVEILTKVDPETVAGRKTLTLGSYYLDYEVRKQVFAFNKKSSDVRISIVDYSQYDGETGSEGMTKLNTDIASGSAPDILILSAAMPIKSYAGKGVFEDLTPYLENDEEISQKEYLTNIQDAFKTDGKTYAIVPSFYASVVTGKTEDIGDGSSLTLDATNELTAKKGADPARMFGIATREDIMYLAMELCGSQFIDWDQSACKFDSPEFIKLLEFIKQFPEKIDENNQEDTSADYRTGKSLFYRDSIGTFDEYVYLKYGVFGTDITMTGFPSQTPGKAAIFPQLEIAINAGSQEKDACWSFVRRFLLDDYQNSIEMYWPVSISALDQLSNKAMEPLYYEDENGNQVEDHIIVNIGGEDIALPRITDTEVDQMYSFLKGLDSEAYYDASVENIIAEEAAAFFAGQKTAEDVAGVIQSRVQIYINENS